MTGHPSDPAGPFRPRPGRRAFLPVLLAVIGVGRGPVATALAAKQPTPAQKEAELKRVTARIEKVQKNIVTSEEYANQLIIKGMAEPLYSIKINSLNFLKNHISFSLIDSRGDKFSSDELYSSGLYAIFYDKNKFIELECIYVGNTEYSIYGRIRRFLQGATETLRNDESHAAGPLCRNRGLDFHHFSVKFLPRNKFPKCSNRNIDDRYIDMYVAPKLDSKFNQKIKK